jgi:hypothetical protein
VTVSDYTQPIKKEGSITYDVANKISCQNKFKNLLVDKRLARTCLRCPVRTGGGAGREDPRLCIASSK